MLQAMKHRGPDSSGFALYGKPTERVVCASSSPIPTRAAEIDFGERLERHKLELESRLGKVGAMLDRIEIVTEYACPGRARLRRGPEGARRLRRGHPRLRGAVGRALPRDRQGPRGRRVSVAEQYGLAGFRGTHAIGHVRMATESDVDIAGAHPYWAYPFADLAVVHNGQLTNYHQWRRRLERLGHRFQSECDSEIIAVYLAEKLTTTSRSRRRSSRASTTSTASSPTSS